MRKIKVAAALGCSAVSAVSIQPHSNLRRATTAAAFAALIALSACGSDGATARDSSAPPQTPAASTDTTACSREHHANRSHRHWWIRARHW